MTLYVGNTALLLHGDGADGSTVFTDDTGKTVTPVGNARISTAQSKFGGSSMYFDGSGDYLTVPGYTLLSETNMCVEAWVRPVLSGRLMPIIGVSNSSVTLLAINDTGKLLVNIGGTFTSVASLQNDEWQHVALVKRHTSFVFYIDGVASGGFTTTAVYGNAGILVGFAGNATYSYAGYIDDLRITTGYPTYTTDFTPPIAPLELFPIFPVQIQAHDPGITKLAKYDSSQPKPVISEVKYDLQDRWPYGPWKTPAVQFEFKGRGVITGTVAEKALPVNTPLRRLVRLHREPDGAFVKAVWSDDAGNYTFNGVRADHKFFVTTFDYAGTYRAVIADNLTPDVLP